MPSTIAHSAKLVLARPVPAAHAAAMTERTLSRVDRLNRRLDVPMSLLSLVMVTLLVIELTGGFAPPYDVWADRLSVGIWGLFVLEFLTKLWLVPDRRRYLRQRWFDVVILALPMLRVFRALRVLRLARGYSGLRFAAWLAKGVLEFEDLAKQRYLDYLLGLSVLVVLGATGAVWALEHDVPSSPMTSFGQTLWWAATLITTVNIGADPVTVPGRIIALLLRLYGQGVFVYLVSVITSYWLPKIQGTPPAESTDEEKPAA